MIGQKNNLEKIFSWRMNRSTPRFIIITGDRGSGRLTLSKQIAKNINAIPVIVDDKIDSVRETIQNAYNVSDTMCYIFRNADRMSVQAQNALLKVVEEPPNNAYFIITLLSPDNTLETIRSRGTLLQVEPYAKEELKELTQDKNKLKFLRNPGEIKEWEGKDFDSVVDFCENVVDGLAEVTDGNALKITQRLKFKEDSDGIEPELFVRIVFVGIVRRLASLHSLSQIVKLTNDCNYRLKSATIKKDSTIDVWLLKVKDVIESNEPKKIN